MLKLGKSEGEQLAQIETNLDPSNTDQLVENTLQAQKNETETQRKSHEHFRILLEHSGKVKKVHENSRIF